MYRIVAYISLAFCFGVALDLWQLDGVIWILVLAGVAGHLAIMFIVSGGQKMATPIFTSFIHPLTLYGRRQMTRFSKNYAGITSRHSLVSVILFFSVGMGALNSHVEQSVRTTSSVTLLSFARENRTNLDAVVEIDGEINRTSKSMQAPCKVLAVYTEAGLRPFNSPPVIWLEIYRGSEEMHKRKQSATRELARYYTKMSTLQPGDIVNVFLRVKSVPKGPFAVALLRKKISLLGQGSEFGLGAVQRQTVRWNDISVLQGQTLDWIKQRVRTSYGNLTSSFLLSFAIGDRTEMNQTVLQVFTALGIIHAFVASGATIRMTVAPVVTRLQKRLKYRQVWYVIGIGSTVVLVFCTGFAPPAVRAGIVYGYELTARVLQRPFDRLTANTVSLVWLVLIVPQLLFDPGVILSYGAATTLALLPRPVDRQLAKWVKWTFLRHLLSRGIAGQIGISPLVAEEFGQFPYFSLLINVLLYPLLEWIIPISFGLCVAACIDPSLLTPVSPFLATVLSTLTTQIVTLHAIPLSFHFNKPPVWELLSYYFAILSLFIWITRYTSTSERKYFS